MANQNIAGVEETASLLTQDAEPYLPFHAVTSTGWPQQATYQESETAGIDPEKDGDCLNFPLSATSAGRRTAVCYSQHSRCKQDCLQPQPHVGQGTFRLNFSSWSRFIARSHATKAGLNLFHFEHYMSCTDGPNILVRWPLPEHIALEINGTLS